MEASPSPLSSRPGFPVTQHQTRQRERLSVRKGACSSRNPPTSTGNPGERTRISDYAAPKMTSFAAFIKESRMSFAEPIGLNRKSGAAEGSAVPRTFLGNVFRQSVPGFSTTRNRLIQPEIRGAQWRDLRFRLRCKQPGCPILRAFAKGGIHRAPLAILHSCPDSGVVAKL